MRATSSVIVGRFAETGLLSNALDAASRCSGRAVFFVGDAGIGKSRLAGECAYRAYERGMPVLRGRATSTGLVVPFRPLIEALSSRFRAAGTPTDPELDPYRPALARLVPEWRQGSSPGYPETVIELAEALLRLLSVLGQERGCVILLEDLHDSDTETIAVVEYVIDNVADLPVLLLGTLRPEPGVALDLVRSAERRQVATVRELAPLGDADVREMTASCLEAAPDEVPQATHERLAGRAGGNPYLVEVLLADLLDSGQLRRSGDRWEEHANPDASVPTGVVRSWSRRLDRFDEPVRELLLCAATLGSRFSVTVLQTVTGFDDRTLFSHLRSAVEANIIAPDGADPDRYTFRHALTAEALVASLAPAERAATARRAALSLAAAEHELGDEQRQLMATLQLAGGDRHGAARQFAGVGRRMLAAGASGSAVTLLERARSLAHESDLRGITESLAVSHAEAGELDAALALTAELPPVPPRSDAAEQRGEAHIRIAWAAVMAERVEEAAGQIRTARSMLGTAVRPELEAALDVVDGHLALLPGHAGHGRQERAQDAARRAAAVAEERSLPVVACQAWQLLALLSRERGFDEADACLERMLAVSEQHALPVWRVEALVRLGANTFMRTGDPARLETARTAAQSLGALVPTQTVDGLLAMNAVMRGEWDGAHEIIERSVAASARVRNLGAHRYLLLASAALAAHRGRRRDLDRAMVRFRRAGGEESLLVPLQLGLCRAFAALLEEDRAGALADLDASLAWEREHPSFFYLSGRYGLRPLLRILDGPGDRAELDATLESPGADLAWNQLFLRLAEGVLHGRAGDTDRAVRSVAAAVADADAFPLARHLGLRLVAGAALAEGWGEPVSWLRTSEEYFYGAGIQPVAAACRAALRQAGASVGQHRGGWDRIPAPLRTSGVTPREYEVFVLLAERPGNQQIARRLSISPRTVEKHMASLLNKTGRADRAALCEFSAECAAERD
ncbi:MULTISPECIES: ATP-binding protein [unclassified Streptomyces]|uniref:ATP-binding protein n=1 Tax=unclassified Streptomyces TaxID=2593676 RepID=UPI00081B5CEB|nr:MULTISPECIES: AAA family ATPase [unclassified Streptomyces]MYQ88056.1 AAA family ATPase [Streptomyces sp. SID4936]SCE52028.1 regulatory protein, luxR family [Streptomyces sp. DvalAA-43]